MLAASTADRRVLAGVAMAAVSAATFATLAILGKLSFATGLTVSNLLALRFVVATFGMAAVSFWQGASRWRIGGGRALALIALGAGCYGLQSALFFGALVDLPASLVELLLYASPALIVLATRLIFGRPLGRWLAIAVIVNLAGVALLVGPAHVSFGIPLAMAIAVPFANAIYFLVAERLMRGMAILPASILVIAGAAIFWVVAASIRQELAIPRTLSAWLLLAGFAIGPSMLGIPFILAAIGRIGSARASRLGSSGPPAVLARIGWAIG